MDELRSVVAGLQELGPYGLLILFIVGLYREWVVIGPTFRRERERGDYYQRMAEQGSTTARKAVDLASEKV